MVGASFFLHSFPTFVYPALQAFTSHVHQVFVVEFHTCSPVPSAIVQDFLFGAHAFASMCVPLSQTSTVNVSGRGFFTSMNWSVTPFLTCALVLMIYVPFSRFGKIPVVFSAICVVPLKRRYFGFCSPSGSVIP